MIRFKHYSPGAWGFIASAVCALLIIFGLVLSLTQQAILRHQQATLIKLARTNGEVLLILKECTSGEETECKRRGAATTAAAIGRIVDANENQEIDAKEILEALERIEAKL